MERFLSQSRLIATKLLRLHTQENEHHKLDSIIEALTSKFFFHGHPINRIEAKELGLKVTENTPPEILTAMWELFLDFEDDLKFKDNFDPVSRLMPLKTGVGTPGVFTELAGFEEDLTWSVVESHTLSSRYEQRVRYILNSDPQLQTSLNAIVLSQRWNQSKPSETQP